MGKQTAGILMPFKGKVGSVVGSSWRGISVIKFKGPDTRSNNAPKQLDAQTKFSVATNFAKSMTELFKITYKNYAQQMTARNFAVGEFTKNAITGTYPLYTIDYSKALISKGSLHSENATTTIQGRVIHWEWTANIAGFGSNPRDRSIMVIYCQAFENAMYKVYGPQRDENASLFDVTAFAGQTVHTWLAFISEDGSKLSNSKYTGSHAIV
jgi:hypothetical protein